MPITAPIFVHADDVLVFHSKEEAESYLEPVDVEPDERGYDAEGRLLYVVVRGNVELGHWSVDQSRARVELVLAEEVPSHGEELRILLLDWLRRADGTNHEPTAGTLTELVERAERVSRHHAEQDAQRRSKMTLWAVGVGVTAGCVALWQWLIR
jgi:hypothetical protein